MKTHRPQPLVWKKRYAFIAPKQFNQPTTSESFSWDSAEAYFNYHFLQLLLR